MAHPPPSAAAAIDSAARSGNSQGRSRPLHTALAAALASAAAGAAVEAVAIAAAGVLVAVAQVAAEAEEQLVDLDMVGFGTQAETVEIRASAGAERGCTFAAKVVVVGLAVMRSFASAAWLVGRVGLGCCRRSSSLRSLHLRRSRVVLVGDKIAGGIVGSGLGAGVAVMTAGSCCWVALVGTGSGMVVMAVALEDIAPEIVPVLGRAVVACFGNLLHNAIVGDRMDPIGVHYPCNSSRPHHLGRRTVCWGIGSTQGAV